MTRPILLLSMLLCVCVLCAPAPALRAAEERAALAVASPDAAKPPERKISDDDLQRVAVAPTTKFPWAGKPPAIPPKPKPAADPAAAAAGAPASGSETMDLSGDMIVKSFGPFTREAKKSNPALTEPDKEVMTMTQNVEIEMVESKSVLRGEHIVIVRDIKTGDTELIEAKGNVQLWSPERTAKGEMLRVEMQKGPNGEVLKNQFVLIGDPAAGKKATLWLRKDPADPSKVDIIEATRFVRDERLDTFKATGNPNAIITMADDAPAAAPKAAPGEKPKDPKDRPATPAVTMGAANPDKPAGMGKASKAAPKPAASTGGAAGGMGNMNMTGGGKVNMRADAEMFFDGATGKLKLSRNVIFIKEGLKPGEGVRMCADDATVTLDVPPPGQPVSAGSAFAGDMKMIDSSGRVEIKSGISTILCDKFKLDSELNVAYMDMLNPVDVVYVFNSSTAVGGDIMMAPKSLKMNLDTQELEAGGPMKTRGFAGPPGSNRGNGPKPEDIKPLVDPKAKASPFAVPVKPGAGGLANDLKKSVNSKSTP